MNVYVRYEKRVDHRTKALWIAKRNPLDSKGPFNNYVSKKSTLVHPGGWGGPMNVHL